MTEQMCVHHLLGKYRVTFHNCLLSSQSGCVKRMNHVLQLFVKLAVGMRQTYGGRQNYYTEVEGVVTCLTLHMQCSECMKTAVERQSCPD